MIQSSSISSTAQLVAKATLLRSYYGEAKVLLSPETPALCEAFLRATSRSGERFTRWIRHRGLRAVLLSLEKTIKPGLSLHYLIRKAIIEESVVTSIEKGNVRQVVMFGAGFDTLCWRLHRRFSNVSFIELDSKALLEKKSRGLLTVGVTGNNLCLQPLTIGSGCIPKTLLECPLYSRDAPTCFVAEGLLMYLDSAAREDLFSFIGQAKHGSHFIFTFLIPGGAYQREDLPLGAALAEYWLRAEGETYQWEISSQNLSALCESNSFELESVIEPRQWVKHSEIGQWQDHILPRDELIAVARRSRAESP